MRRTFDEIKWVVIIALVIFLTVKFYQNETHKVCRNETILEFLDYDMSWMSQAYVYDTTAGIQTFWQKKQIGDTFQICEVPDGS